MTRRAPWPTKKLADVMRIQNGFAFDSNRFNGKQGMPLIRIRDLKVGTKTQCLFDGPFDNAYLVHAGDILIGMDGEFRAYKWAGADALLNQRVCRLQEFSPEVEPDFVLFQLNRHLREIEDITPFATVKHLSSRTIGKIELTLPCRDEQRRVVGRIKECLSRIEEMERMRQEADDERSHLLRATLRDLFDEAATNGKPSSIGAVTLASQYGTNVKCSTNTDGTPILRIPNVAGGHVNLEKMKFAHLADRERAKVRLENGDLLVVRTNGSSELVGRCAVFKEPGEYGYASYLIRFRLNQAEALPDYVSFFLQSPQGRDSIARIRQTSAGQFNVNSENLRNIVFPLVKPKAQAVVIEKALGVQRIADTTGAELDGTETEIDILRESILREAFAGNL